MIDKLSPAHLALNAYVYVRQSTQQQMRTHHESRQRQYALADRARQLGFAGVVVIDEDLGRSGSGLVERPGFGQLLTAICQNEAGAVFALEASRLARNNRDWHHLLDLCAMTGTLLIDDQGMYDPRDINDRLVLGLQGTMSEFELSLFRQRARQAFEQKVGRGHAMWEVPTGFVRTDDDRMEKTPDRRVQEAVVGVFRKFRELGSARQTMLWYRDENVLVPRVVGSTRGRDVVWSLPTETRIRQMLTNPTYAGVLAYGRTVARTVVEQGRARQAGRRRKPREEWKVLILDNHAGYISWEDFHLHLRMLEENSAMRRAKRRCCQERWSVVVRADALWTVRPADVRELQRQRRQTTALCVSRKPSRSRLSGVSVLGSCSRRGCRVRATLGSSPASRCSSGARRPGATLRPTAREAPIAGLGHRASAIRGRPRSTPVRSGRSGESAGRRGTGEPLERGLVAHGRTGPTTD